MGIWILYLHLALGIDQPILQQIAEFSVCFPSATMRLLATPQDISLVSKLELLCPLQRGNVDINLLSDLSQRADLIHCHL